MEWLVELALRGLAVVAIALLLSQLVLTLLFSGFVGVASVFVAASVAVGAATSGVVLLAMEFSYPQTLTAVGLSSLLWLVVPASAASVLLFDFALDGLVLGALRHLGLGIAWIGEALAGGLINGLMLLVAVRFVPDSAGVSVGAALVAGLICALVRYYVGLYFRYLGRKDCE